MTTLGKDTTGAINYGGTVISLAELQNQQARSVQAMKADVEDRARYEKLFYELQSKVVPAAFTLGGRDGEKLISALYHGETILGMDERSYPFRLLYTRYVVEMINKCRDRLTDPIEVTIYEPRFVEMLRTTYIGGVPMSSTYSMPAGTQPSYTLTTPSKFQSVVGYLGPKDLRGQPPLGQRLMDLFMPPASPYSESEIRNGVGELFSRFDCGSKEIEIVGENMVRQASALLPSLQREALLGMARRLMYSPGGGPTEAPEAIREEDAIENYMVSAKSLKSQSPWPRDPVESPAGRVWTNAEIFAQTPYAKGDESQTGAFFFKDYRGQLYVAGFESWDQPMFTFPGEPKRVPNPDRLIVLAVPYAELEKRIQAVLAGGQDRGGVYLAESSTLIEEDFPAYRLAAQNYAWRLNTFLQAAARAVTLPPKR